MFSQSASLEPIILYSRVEVYCHASRWRALTHVLPCCKCILAWNNEKYYLQNNYQYDIISKLSSFYLKNWDWMYITDLIIDHYICTPLFPKYVKYLTKKSYVCWLGISLRQAKILGLLDNWLLVGALDLFDQLESIKWKNRLEK